MSSRNAYLTGEQRAQAPVIRRALRIAREAWRSGEKDAAKLRRIVAQEIARAPVAKVDYIEVVAAESIQPVTRTATRSLIAAAVFFGNTRLIDNILLKND